MPSANLEVRLSLQDRLRAGFRKAGSAVDSFAKRTRRTLGAINQTVFSLRGGIAGLGAAFTIGGIARLTASIAENADQIGKLSQRLGVSTQFLSEFRFVAGQTGVDARTLDLSLQRVTRRFGEIARTGKGTAAPALKELGADIFEAVRRGESFESLLPLLVDRLNAVEDPARRLSIAFQLFDSEGAKLVQTLGIGSKEIDRLRREARRLGLTIDKEAAESAAKFNDEVDKLKKTFVGFANEVILPVLDDVAGFVADLRKLIADVRELQRAVAELGNSRRPQRFGGPGPERPPGRFVDPFTGRPGQPSPGPGSLVAGVDENGNIVAGPGGGPDGGLFVGPQLPAGGSGGGGGGGEIKDTTTDIDSLRLSQEKLGKNVFETNRRLTDQHDALSQIRTGTEGANAGLNDLRQQFSSFNVARNAVNELGNALSNRISTGLIEIVEGTKSVKDAFKDMALGILQDLQRIIIKALVARAIGAILGPAPGTPGGVASFQSGGFVPAGRTQRAVLHGPELVVPLNRQFDPSSLGGGGGGNVFINVNAIDVADFDTKINDSLKRQETAVAGIVGNASRNNQALRNAFAGR